MQQMLRFQEVEHGVEDSWVVLDRIEKFKAEQPEDVGICHVGQVRTWRLPVARRPPTRAICTTLSTSRQHPHKCRIADSQNSIYRLYVWPSDVLLMLKGRSARNMGRDGSKHNLQLGRHSNPDKWS